jgi:hypothetical protein
MVEVSLEQENPEEIQIERLNFTGCWLKDDGVAELLPLLAANFPLLSNLNVSACKMTHESQPAFCDFLSSQFPEGRKLTLELRLQNIKKVKIAGASQDVFTLFKLALRNSKRARPNCQVMLKY